MGRIYSAVEDDSLATTDDIEDCYRYLLRREPDPEGLTHWSKYTQSKRLGLRALWKAFVDSPEFQERCLPLPAMAAVPERYWCMETNGFRIYLDRRDSLVSASIAVHGYEPHVTAMIRQLLNPGSVFLDLGANVGYFTLLAASLVGEYGQVIAFEPRPDNAALLTLSIHENRFSNVILHALAVAECEQEFKVYPSEMSSLSHVVEAGRSMSAPQWSYTVRAVALDKFLADLPRLDIVKADIDGNEIRAFRGMRELIRRHRPVLVFEFAPSLLVEISRAAPETLLEDVWGHSYDIFILERDRNQTRGPQNVQGILDAYTCSGSTHVDLIAYPKRENNVG